jgi:ribosome-binding protein aMBF1 (putative translation factor)
MSVTKKEMRNTPKNFQDLVTRVKRTDTFDQEALRSQISDQISCLLTVQGMSKAELAKKLKTSRSYVTKILQGNANFTLDSLVQIARVLGCKYVPFFVPVNEWRQIESSSLSTTQVAASAAKAYEAHVSVKVKTEIK